MQRPKKDEVGIKKFLETIDNNVSLNSVNSMLTSVTALVKNWEQLKPKFATEFIAIFHNPIFYAIFALLMAKFGGNWFWLVIPANFLVFFCGTNYIAWEREYRVVIKKEDQWLAAKEKLEGQNQIQTDSYNHDQTKS